MSFRHNFAAFSIGCFFVISFANAKTYEASDSEQISLSALSLASQDDCPPFAGSVDEVLAQMMLATPLTSDFEKLQPILEGEEKGVEFIANTTHLEKRMQIRFLMKLEMLKAAGYRYF